ncbi:hypothetical protein CKN96_15715 [Carnobacterium maltaromaticum]|uniref:hypothetical protein n=1 Tax=Carnobacterium maltaromaticum TaxID=2751 RepID=UPI0010733450|nr:hypothetical protein [Carnobacterium maltaromaticum]TFJ56029.1 hypothetical protein CKN96_15715 [Carnobacterium maltaromaticum]
MNTFFKSFFVGLISIFLVGCSTTTDETKNNSATSQSKNLVENTPPIEETTISKLTTYGSDDWTLSKFDWNGFKNTYPDNLPKAVADAQLILEISLQKYFGIGNQASITFTNPNESQDFFALSITNLNVSSEEDLLKFKQNAEALIADVDKQDINLYSFYATLDPTVKDAEKRKYSSSFIIIDNGTIEEIGEARFE